MNSEMPIQIRLLLPVVALLLVYPAASAHAYIDPGTGSIALQLLLGGVAGAMVIGKLYWARIQAFFTKVFPGKTGGAKAEKDR